MAQTKNICGKIPLELHEQVRQEIEQSEISTQIFLQRVIEEHFLRKGESPMTARTIAVQVTEELFQRMKAVVAHKECRQKDFLIRIIEQAIEAEEEKMRWEAAGESEDGVDYLEEEEEPEDDADEMAEDEPEGEEPAGTETEETE